MNQSLTISEHNQGDWLGTMARLGFAAKGVVYMVIGGLAIEVAQQGASQSMGSQGAISAIAQQPFGQFLLWVVAVGLFSYAAWRLTQATIDPEDVGADAKGKAKRVGYAGSGVAHLALAAAAIGMAMGSSGAGSGSAAKSWTAALMSQPWGQWAVGAIALGIVVAAFVQLYRAYSASFMKVLAIDEMSAGEEVWARRTGRVGHAARAVVFAIIAYFLLTAALNADPQQAVGLDGALRTLAQQPRGPILLSLAAAGLFLYGIFMVVKARYRELPGQR